MTRVNAKSKTATRAYDMLQSLQARFAAKLSDAVKSSPSSSFETLSWLRDEGRHGGGSRMVASNRDFFNRGSINVSQVHYDDLPEKPLASANALSTIIHPDNPHIPSTHIHISWTELKSGRGYWRIMADLNPAIVHAEQKDLFEACLRKAAPALYEEAVKQGERYFYIPALKRHRGVSHFYLEDYASADPEKDFLFAQTFGESIIDCYAGMLKKLFVNPPAISAEDRKRQLAYHTLYLFQVLTLDRGTTSGLMVHDQNDEGIMGSLPAFIDRKLLASWRGNVPTPQDQLVQDLVNALPASDPCPINQEEKIKLASVVRSHYRKFPEALNLQASGGIIPPTVDNHGAQGGT